MRIFYDDVDAVYATFHKKIGETAVTSWATLMQNKKGSRRHQTPPRC